MYVLGDPPDYEPTAERSVAAMAARAGVSAEEYCYDYLAGGDGGRMLFFPLVNYVTGDHSVVRDLLTDPDTLFGLSDGGAHCGSICDGAIPTFMLTHWVRDRSRGPRLPLEFVVKRMTSETADFMGLTGPWASRARAEGGCERDRPAGAAGAPPGNGRRPAGGRAATDPARGRVWADHGVRRAGVRGGRGDGGAAGGVAQSRGGKLRGPLRALLQGAAP